MADVYSIIEDQKFLFNSLKRLSSCFETKVEKTRGFAQTILEEIESCAERFKDFHTQLSSLIRDQSINTKDIPYFIDERYNQFLDLYYTAKAKLLDFLNEVYNPHSPTFHSTFSASSHIRSETFTTQPRLPKIEIPTFSGDYLSWISYKDMFNSLVHSNNTLSGVQKYYFLKSSCSGIPLEIVSEYPASDASYALAWNALHERYHNKRKIVETIYQKFFSLPSSNGSAESIQTIMDTTRNTLALLRTQDICTDGWDSILVFIIVNRLDSQTRKEWEQSLKGSTDVALIKDLLRFLEITFRTLESVSNEDHLNFGTFSSSSRMFNSTRTNRSRNNFGHSAHLTTFSTDTNCPCCNKRHLLFKCFKFAAFNSNEKREFLNSKRICRNCLNVGHFSYNCRTASRCQICQQDHHTTVHNEYFTLDPVNPQPQSVDIPSTSSTDDISANIACNVCSFQKPQVLLGTMRVVVKTKTGIFNLRAILDQCAQASFITQQAVESLKLSLNKTYAKISGVVGNQPHISRKYAQFTLFSNTEADFKMNCNAFVLPKITAYQPLPLNESTLPCLHDLSLADPNFLKTGDIDLLLGGDVYGDIVLPNQRKFHNSIFLQLTHFGWLVSGPTSTFSYENDISINICSLDKQLCAFWEQEELIEKKSLSEEEELCEQHFIKTTTRDKCGQYTVSLPFKSLLEGRTLPLFSHTDYSALSRLKSVEAKCKSNPHFGQLYMDFMKEYETLGHMKNVGTYPSNIERNGFFLPHHGVLNNNSSTTKLRVVFDGSSKRVYQPSLNEELAAGPALQNDLPTIINRWRRFKIGFRADLEKMFRQIRIVEDQQKYQQILWRSSQSSEISIFKLSTVTYGTAPAPFLAIRVLKQLALDEKINFPLASKVLDTDTYVDDVISGADDLEGAYELHIQLCSMLKSGNFNLRKWTTNSKELLALIPEEFREKSSIYELNENTVKALGLEWNTTHDSFSFKINFKNADTNVTKRSLLSDAAKLYDPLGWLAPTTIIAKIEFQNLWLLGIDWNDKLPEKLRVKWLQYRRNLKHLEDIKIPRWIGFHNNDILEIHGFCDSSKLAYAAVVYSKTVSLDGSIKVNLIQSKTKVGPLKRMTIPRMELSGATLLVNLVKKITSSLDKDISQVLFWTDSTTVLSWIRGQSSKWPVFVGNRVAEIQRNSATSQWRYVSTKDNPADCASRGISAQELVQHNLWWNGPKWLNELPINWPKQPNLNFYSESDEPEDSVNIHSTEVKKSIEKGYSEMTGFLTSKELKGARLELIRISQIVDFYEEIEELQTRDAHHTTLHGGLTQMQAYVSSEYWILSARNIAKLVFRKCIICFKYNAKSAQQMMGNLPRVRLQPSRAFRHSGVDYAGPITIKQSTARNSITSKGYICLFVCMVTKALHLEAVTSLTTEAFLSAFRRFVGRRGTCTDIYSDCGTNFIGANKELQILYHRNKSSIPQYMIEQLASKGTTWHFIPPASPHFGGLWEAGVKSTKYHLKRIMQNHILTFEELTTLLVQIESCLNSRPLCPLTSEPSDCMALTPAHFLIGEPTICVPDENLLDSNINRLSRWKVVERLKQHFWQRWSMEWLSRLQARPKWLKIAKNAEIGDLVIVLDERFSPGDWPLARIHDVHPGKDGFVRVVTLFSNGKLFKRPISKIAFLPVNDQFNEKEISTEKNDITTTI